MAVVKSFIPRQGMEMFFLRIGLFPTQIMLTVCGT